MISDGFYIDEEFTVYDFTEKVYLYKNDAQERIVVPRENNGVDEDYY